MYDFLTLGLYFQIYYSNKKTKGIFQQLTDFTFESFL